MRKVFDSGPFFIPEKSKAFVLQLKGDGKAYNFRVRTPNGCHSYIFSFPTKDDGQWEYNSIPFNKMEARFGGFSVDVPNYAGENIVELRLLIGINKKNPSR